MYDEDDDIELEWEQDRHALASLLGYRGCDTAAAIVAASAYRSVNVGGFDGPSQFQVTLSVPPGLFDRADAEFRDVIDEACSAVVGRERYVGLIVAVRRQPYEAGWEAQVIAALDKRWVTSERVDTPAIEVAPR